jgi:hypothetical protein
MDNLTEIVNSLNKANMYINKAISANSVKDIEQNLWRVNSELEYCLFIFNLSIIDDNIRFNWKPDKSLIEKLKKLDLNNKLKFIRNYLLKIIELIKADLYSAYKRAVILITLSRMFYKEVSISCRKKKLRHSY